MKINLKNTCRTKNYLYICNVNNDKQTHNTMTIPNAPLISYKQVEWLPMHNFMDEPGLDCQVSVNGLLSAHIMFTPGEEGWEVFTSVEGNLAEFLFKGETLTECKSFFLSTL